MKKAALIAQETPQTSNDKVYDKTIKSKGRPLTSVLEEGIVFEDNEDEVSGEFGYNKINSGESRFSI
jgi:hypothetical protein